jgi:hypothetical protein
VLHDVIIFVGDGQEEQGRSCLGRSGPTPSENGVELGDRCSGLRCARHGDLAEDAVFDGDRRQLKMLPFARLAQSPSLFVASLEFADHVATSCSTACIRSHWD